jgi:hypothetical protein
MKTLCFLAATLAFTLGSARNLNAQATDSDQSMSDDQTLQHALEVRLTLEGPKFNEIARPRVSYDGVLVTAIQSHRLWELLNPAAPPEYGTFADTVVFDPVGGQMSGVKLFSIRF